MNRQTTKSNIPEPNTSPTSTQIDDPDPTPILSPTSTPTPDPLPFVDPDPQSISYYSEGIPEAAEDIECLASWTTIKTFGLYAYNSMVTYDGKLILTTVTPGYGSTVPQKVIAREINPNSGFDSGWYELGFTNSQNSHVLIEQDGKLNLFVYGNSQSPSRTVYKSKYISSNSWDSFEDTGATNLGRTGPQTAIFESALYRFFAEYGPIAILQKCG